MQYARAAMILSNNTPRSGRAMLNALTLCLALLAVGEAAAIALTWFARELQGVMA